MNREGYYPYQGYQRLPMHASMNGGNVVGKRAPSAAVIEYEDDESLRYLAYYDGRMSPKRKIFEEEDDDENDRKSSSTSHVMWMLLKLFLILIVIGLVLAFLYYLGQKNLRLQRQVGSKIEIWSQPGHSKCQQCQKTKCCCKPEPIVISSATNAFFISNPEAPRVWETFCASCEGKQQANCCNSNQKNCCQVYLSITQDAREDRTTPINDPDLSGKVVIYNCLEQIWFIEPPIVV